MKIAQVITRMDTLGGAQVHVRDLSNHLAAQRCEVIVITGKAECSHSMVNVKYKQCPSLIRELHPFYDVRAILEVRRILKDLKPDLVATHSSKAGLIGRIAAWSLRIPTVFTAHGWAFTEGVSSKKRRFYMAIEKVVGLITNRVITVSDYDRNLAISSHVLPPRKIETVHNGVLPSKHVTSLKVEDNALVNILMVARFDIPKKQLMLVRACEKLNHLPWQLSFVGEGSQLDEVKEYVKENQLEERVLFYGSMKSIEEPLNNAKVFVLLSDYEGLPLSILEAMQVGLPIIASDVGGVKEAVINSENGFLIPNHDEEFLHYSLSELLLNASLRKRMGIRGKALFEEKFTFDRMLRHTIKVYERVVNNHSNKRR